MKRTLKSVLSALFGRKKQIHKETYTVIHNSVHRDSNLKEQATQKLTRDQENELKDKLRCEQILNYWLDTELFDLPECPMDYKKQIISEPADYFSNSWGVEAPKKIHAGKLQFTTDSRLFVMFQCHIAGYIAKSEEKHPNYITPRTYLVGQALIPKWDNEKKQVKWTRSEDDEDLVINLATIRTLYRRCNSSIPNSMSLSDWVEARMIEIESMLHKELSPEDEGNGLDTEELQNKIIHLNRKIAEQFWPDESARKFMLNQCQPIESRFADKLDQPSELKSGAVTFRWRYCYYPEGSENQQLGPFFVDDLERAISSVGKKGVGGLSRPLQDYLLGRKKQIEIGNAVNQGDLFLSLTNKLIKGRWPDNPDFGLSLLQCVAVNVSTDLSENPIVAVNGPPGTGKTTLLKDVIADRFVTRTIKLSELCEKEEWLSSSESISSIMQYSMVVASSNNKAVENISKEIPALSKLPEQYSDVVKHFQSIAPEEDWGLFCAVLGNSSNRRSFKEQLSKLKDHFRNIKDYLHLQFLVNLLKKKGPEKADEVFKKFVTDWKDNKRISIVIEDLQECHANKKYQEFFKPFASALQRVQNNELTVEQFSASWKGLDEEQWELSIEALEAFKKQWFGKKLYSKHLTRNLDVAQRKFNEKLARVSKVLTKDNQEFKLDKKKHLVGTQYYSTIGEESENDAEKRLQLSSPFSSSELNDCRSQLFIAALALNEAILECAASQLSKHWEKLDGLIDGYLETNESTPEHQQLWSILFLFFPVVSTSLSSVENQFKLMQKKEGFGLVMFDESGQAVNYHVTGMLQRSRQAIFVGDPIQLEPVVTMPPSIDLAIAEDFFPISKKDGNHCWGDDYLISSNSAQSIADKAGKYIAKIGERKVGIPLLVHRRCTEPMFSISNRIAYDDKMVLASKPFGWKAIQSGWINVDEDAEEMKKTGYANSLEACTALDLVKFLVEEHPDMVQGGVYIITPFSIMRRELKHQWKEVCKDSSNHSWMQSAFGTDKAGLDVESFSEHNIGTVHSFQGKEASTVILCTSASNIRKKQGGITWVNSKPNLLNVAVTRAQHHLFVIGNQKDWSEGTLSAVLQNGEMQCYANLEDFKRQDARLIDDYLTEVRVVEKASSINFDFG
ncbi:DEAD/DEAH box helicase [Aliidiomarina soli]|uniref:DNA2/NAM7 helicase-like C-terminal domain-containing protein n=1 Tax=Aliidiomarina soli TaxID=1928574 RepID=A0A432WM96_9GAMM|nr:AAA domain-containing protein [Aliidiomarina soli]RUO34884.1 hypothetical protein CWE14_02480 [Aliidiomarina soli]